MRQWGIWFIADNMLMHGLWILWLQGTLCGRLCMRSAVRFMTITNGAYLPCFCETTRWVLVSDGLIAAPSRRTPPLGTSFHIWRPQNFRIFWSHPPPRHYPSRPEVLNFCFRKFRDGSNCYKFRSEGRRMSAVRMGGRVRIERASELQIRTPDWETM